MPRIFLRCLLWNVYFPIFGESPQFAVVEENTCYICIECSDSDCVADVSAVCFIQRFESIYCKNFSAVYVFSVSSKLPSNLHFFHFSLPCRIISYSSVLDSLITRGQDYKEKQKTRLKTNVKRTVLNNTKLRHF